MKVEIPDKVCPHCGGTTWLRSVHKSGFKHKCYERDREVRIAYRKKIVEDPVRGQLRLERERAANRKSYQKHKEVVLQRCREYRAISLTPEKKQQRHANQRKLRRELHTSVMKAALKSIGILSPTPEQIERYRTYLKTFRQWREVKRQLQQN